MSFPFRNRKSKAIVSTEKECSSRDRWDTLWIRRERSLQRMDVERKQSFFGIDSSFSTALLYKMVSIVNN